MLCQSLAEYGESASQAKHTIPAMHIRTDLQRELSSECQSPMLQSHCNRQFFGDASLTVKSTICIVFPGVVQYAPFLPALCTELSLR